MQQHEMVSAVAPTTGTSSADAERAVRATVRVLGARPAGGQAGNLATQLPPGYADLLGTEPVQHH